jgi:hypothetical protein
MSHVCVVCRCAAAWYLLCTTSKYVAQQSGAVGKGVGSACQGGAVHMAWGRPTIHHIGGLTQGLSEPLPTLSKVASRAKNGPETGPSPRHPPLYRGLWGAPCTCRDRLVQTVADSHDDSVLLCGNTAILGGCRDQHIPCF